MRKHFIGRLTAVMALSIIALGAKAQQQSATETVSGVVRAFIPQRLNIDIVRVTNCQINGDTAHVELNNEFSKLPLTATSLQELKNDMATALNRSGNPCRVVELMIGGYPAERYVYTDGSAHARSHAAFVSELSGSRHYAHGLDGNIIALWASHGRYYSHSFGGWVWQRPRLMESVEDLLPTSFVTPFLEPMLENAGAYVWNARERDTHRTEVIVDNDKQLAQDGYSDRGVLNAWTSCDSGFAYIKPVYSNGHNPFLDGTYRKVDATSEKGRLHLSESTWSARVDADGDYAIYVSYHTLPNSVDDALYTVNCNGMSRKFRVNQRMAGGVWVYLGTFPLKAGLNENVVTLSNYSHCKGGVVTADAVKIGGGMGNISRGSHSGSVNYSDAVSGYPRFAEGARYFLQWSGFPSSVYNLSGGTNDYKDDYRSRAEWVNYLAGGSEALPGQKGLNVPIDLSFAFHTDAGITSGDNVVGSMSIYNTRNFGNYADGTPRIISRDLAQMVDHELMRAITAGFDPQWNSRGIVHRDLYEVRVPQVPGMLLELLSHQNFADMRLAHDPNFQFAVSRAIYKAMLRFIGKRDGREVVVQPLPVNSFAIRPAATAGTFTLSWKATTDSLESSATPVRYLVMERTGNDCGFREIADVATTSYTVAVTDNLLHSYQVVALNDGGRSFPSETLSLGVVKGAKGMAMVVNGFTRVSAPDWEDYAGVTGFTDETDHGVPYISTVGHIGAQYERKRAHRWRVDDSGGWGATRATYEARVMAGNSFDYPAVHGDAIMKAGYSFVSSSVQAVEQSSAPLGGGYAFVDLIMGKQKSTPNGPGAYPARFPVFTTQLAKKVEAYCKQGGNVILSGSYVASDVFNRDKADSLMVHFATDVLGYRWGSDRAAVTGKVHSVATVYPQVPENHKIQFSNTLNDSIYCVESPDAIFPVANGSSTFLRYCENGMSAGVISELGGYRTAVLGFPIETVLGAEDRATLMRYIIHTLTNQ